MCHLLWVAAPNSSTRLIGEYGQAPEHEFGKLDVATFLALHDGGKQPFVCRAVHSLRPSPIVAEPPFDSPLLAPRSANLVVGLACIDDARTLPASESGPQVKHRASPGASWTSEPRSAAAVVAGRSMNRNPLMRWSAIQRVRQRQRAYLGPYANRAQRLAVCVPSPSA
jgi:hypothetical protein